MTPCDSNVNHFFPMESIKLEFQSITPQGKIITVIFHFEFSFYMRCNISPKLHEKLDPLSNYTFAWEKGNCKALIVKIKFIGLSSQ